MASSECESEWLRDMNNLIDSNQAMDVEEDEILTLKDMLTAKAYEKYRNSLKISKWNVYTRSDAMYSRLGMQFECYPFSRSTPSAYVQLLNQVSVGLKYC